MGTPVTCAALNPCHLAGTCNAQTGACSNPQAANGAPCSDGNSCTQTDTCQSGTCVGTNPVTCGSGDLAGACNPATGQCASPPQAACTSIDRTVPSTIWQTSACLYTGANPPQVGVAQGTIVAARAAVLRGRVLDLNSNPLPGISVTVLGSPQYGSTVTMGDGTFAMAVNGGGPLVVAYAASGYLQVQRTLNFVPWNDYAVLPDVVLRALDTQASAVDFSGASVVFQVAQGTPTVNSSGTRTATLLIPPGTQASLVTDAGATAVTTLTVRATEYSFGSTGPLAMPGTLPTASAYTYAVELSADEAIAAGASVDFSAPLLSYTDNFLAFTVGQPVPAGYYNTAQGVWVGSPDGLVIAIVSVVDGVANIDVTGDGVADSTASLEAVGITAAEQAALASVYAAPTSLWRVSIPHFSPWDFNWGWGPPPDAGAPSVPGAMQSSPVPDNGCQSDDSFAPNGSTIECQNGILHESNPDCRHAIRVGVFERPCRRLRSAESSRDPADWADAASCASRNGTIADPGGRSHFPGSIRAVTEPFYVFPMGWVRRLRAIAPRNATRDCDGWLYLQWSLSYS